jgi:hypothetical protein
MVMTGPASHRAVKKARQSSALLRRLGHKRSCASAFFRLN